MKVFPFEDTSVLDNITHSKYLTKYLKSIGCQTIVLEPIYVDKEFIIDYSLFYARAFENHPRFTERYHFFTSSFTHADFLHILNEGTVEQIREVQKAYLGFAVVKPIFRDGERCLGRTVISPYPNKHTNGQFRYFTTTTQHASLYGIPLDIQSLPFQTQDPAVGACATTALWISTFPLKKIADIPIYSLAEITEKSFMYLGDKRRFPSSGLSLWEMRSFIDSLNLEVEILNVEKLSDQQLKTNIIMDFIKAHLACELPIIATLELRKLGDNEVSGFHAAVISGYRSDKHGTIQALYVHDDRIGPYSRVESENGFLNWLNEWVQEFNYEELRLTGLITPIYPKIRLPFGLIYLQYLDQKQAPDSQNLGTMELFLAQVNPYKEFLLDKTFTEYRDVDGNILSNSSDAKIAFLTSLLPRFVWVIRCIGSLYIADFIFDATATSVQQIARIGFYKN